MRRSEYLSGEVIKRNEDVVDLDYGQGNAGSGTVQDDGKVQSASDSFERGPMVSEPEV